MKGGLFERFQSMPIARSSVLWAHVLTSLVANMISLVVVVLVALLMGFRSGAGVLDWLAVAGILLLFTLALTWLAVIPGLTASSIEGASAFAYPLIFLPFISSAFVPTDSMPAPVQAFAENQPVTSIVNVIRSLFADLPLEQYGSPLAEELDRPTIGSGRRRSDRTCVKGSPSFARPQSPGRLPGRRCVVGLFRRGDARQRTTVRHPGGGSSILAGRQHGDRAGPPDR